MQTIRFRSSLAVALLAIAGIAHADDPGAAWAALEASGSSDPQAWHRLAIDAREAGEPGIAADALDRAEALGLAPVPLALENARQAQVAGDADAAVSALQALADGGFTGVTAITGDPVLGALAGNAGYDVLVAEMETRAYPCAHQDRFRAFDFWLGDWDVHTPDGTFAGTNRIRSGQRGCVLNEEWQSVTGGTGSSINYLDADTGEWVQVWNDASGSQIDIRGGLTDEGMQLTGRIHYVASGTSAAFRGLWTPLPDGRVRQFFEQSNDGGQTWIPWFEGFYSRRAPAD